MHCTFVQDQYPIRLRVAQEECQKNFSITLKVALIDFQTSQVPGLAPLSHEVEELDRAATVKGVLRLKLNVPLVIVIARRARLLELFSLPRNALNGFDPSALRLF